MKINKFKFNLLALAGVFFILSACNSGGASHESTTKHDDTSMLHDVDMHNDGVEISKAICIMMPTEGNDVKGTVTFTQTDAGIRIVADIEGLTPGEHGFHIHEWGDISKSDGTAAGGHFNPEGHDHAGPHDAVRHAGDMGNLIADENGKAHYDEVDDLITFSGKNNIIGRSIIIHVNADDLVSQPTGDAGGRVAQGVIGVAK